MLILLTDNSILGKRSNRLIDQFQRVLGSASPWTLSETGKQGSRFDESRLLRIIEEINLYLPDDWRLTRARNDFRVFVQDGAEAFVLSGESYRKKDGSILQVVEAVLRPDEIHPTDTAVAISSGRLGRAAAAAPRVENEQALLDRPDLIRPNLYFFRPRFEDCPSPLFARQYERVSRDAALIEFHRLHPLTRDGLDRHHFRWIQWSRFGEVRRVKIPAPDFHGRDYWKVPLIASAHEARLELLRRQQLERNGIAMSEHQKSEGSYEIEHKLQFCGSAAEWAVVPQIVGSVLRSLGMTGEPTPPASQSDTYFDDASGTLSKEGASLRLRNTPETIRITLKAKRPSADRAAPGVYDRFEEEETVSLADANAFIAGRTISSTPLSRVKQLIPRCGTVRPVIKVETARQIIYGRNAQGQLAEICLDDVKFVNGNGDTVGTDREIEVEAKGMPTAEVGLIAQGVARELPTRPSAKSKYERALAALG